MSLRGRSRSLFSLLFEVALIAVGVFLALWTNNWHEEREHRAKAQATLHNFVSEMEVNRDAIQRNRQYHETFARELRDFLARPEPATEERLSKTVHFEGMRPVIFEHTAWDLALATHALSWLKPELAFSISKVYTQQNSVQQLQDSFLTAAFTPASLSGENVKGLVTAMEYYLIEINIKEPAMVSLYEKIIPEVKSALSDEGHQFWKIKNPFGSRD